MSRGRSLVASLAALGALSVPLALPAQDATATHVSVTLTAGAVRLTKDEGGGEYFRRRITTGAANAVAKALGAPRERGDRRPEDDVYLLAFGRAPDGAPFSRIVLAPSGALFRVYPVGRGDDGDGDDIDDVPLWDGTLSATDTLSLVVVMLEYDADAADTAITDAVESRLAGAERIGLSMARHLVRGDEGATRAALDIAHASFVANHLIGAMHVEVRAVAGKPQATWRALHDARDKGHSRFMRGRPLKPRWFQLGGQGARYEVHLRVSAPGG